MAAKLDIDVKVTGALFRRDVPRVVRDALVAESLRKIDERLMRKGRFGSGGKGKGVQANYVSHRTLYERPEPTVEVSSTLLGVRTKGTSWVRKNVAIVKSMAPRVLRKAAERAAADLSRA